MKGQRSQRFSLFFFSNQDDFPLGDFQVCGVLEKRKPRLRDLRDRAGRVGD